MGQGDIQLEPRAGKGTCSTEPEKQETTPSSSSSSLTLLDVLSNPIILDAVAPILLISGVLNLAATSRAFRDLISANPSVYRYLDLSNVRAARLRPNELSSGTPAQQTESEDDFYSRPLRNIFSTLKQKNILQHVQTLVLDGLSVTAELCHDIINGSDYNVRTLSILDVSNLNHAKLRASLAYACRKTRPEGSPKLRALYVFGDITPWAARMLHGAPANASTNPGQEAQRVWSFAHRSKPDAWWSRKGCMIAPHHATQEWAECLIACQGIIAFDAVVCQGPRHYNSPAYGVKTMPARVSNQPAVARYAVKPCHMCGECPEGLLTPAADCRSSLPLLAPPPATSASLRAATAPGPGSEAFVPRCMDCLEERYCTGCYKFWCESCYSTHGSSPDRSESPGSVNDDGALTPPDESPFSFSAAKSKVRQDLCSGCLVVMKPADSRYN